MVIVKQKNETLHALSGLCAHKQGELSLGDLVEIEDAAFIVCPRHRKKFPGGLHIHCESGSYSCDHPSSEEVKGEWKSKVFPTLVFEGWLFLGE